MNTLIESEIKENHNTANSLLSLFFLGLDAIIYIILFSLFSCDLKNLSSAKQRLYYIITLDGLTRLIGVYLDVYNINIVQETTFTLISTLEFYLALSILDLVFSDPRNELYSENELRIKNKTLFSIIFFCLVFCFKGISSKYGLLSTIQYVCIFITITIMYKYLSNKIDIFLTNVEKKSNLFTTKIYMANIPFFIFLYLSINYILKLFSLMIDNKLYESYMSMICIIFKEVGKYLVVLLLICIYNIFEKYIKSSDPGFAPSPITQIEKPKTQIQVYKDEEETIKL